MKRKYRDFCIQITNGNREEIINWGKLNGFSRYASYSIGAFYGYYNGKLYATNRLDPIPPAISFDEFILITSDLSKYYEIY